MVTNDLLSRGEVMVNGDAVLARQVANQIALRDAIEKYGASKVFTFHRDVKSAQSFVSHGPEGVATHLADVAADVRRLTSNSQTRAERGNESQSLVTSAATSGFQTFHVNGTMPTARREREMRDFRAAPHAVISNARCLTEGVDVPAVDMVAFLSPRRSRVDIVQATGRAMRRSPGKTMGYVLVPLYVELAASESVEAAVSRSAFDEVLIDQRAKHKRGNLSASRMERLQALPGWIWDDRADRWLKGYEHLVRFAQRQGHTRVLQDHNENGFCLGSWVGSQRQRYKEGALQPRRAEMLARLPDWSWDTIESAWDAGISALTQFVEREGNAAVPDRHSEGTFKLGSWVRMQRTAFQTKTLPVQRIRRLEEFRGWIWDKRNWNWEHYFDLLVAFGEACSRKRTQVKRSQLRLVRHNGSCLKSVRRPRT